ncbi:MAG: class I SAM-dependent methyltransferase [Pseudorhodoplanes sp.]|nr:class I SAM-dependent methyltransferase [Pseudorhodoplanes sp.]
MSDNPASYRQIWNHKPALRAVYGDIYRRILDATANGPILEIGGGSGNFKSFAPRTVSTDIVSAPWLDAVCDAQRLPFAPDTFANVVMVDVLHHIEYPTRAMNEFARVLRKGGRLIFCEPAITPLSGIFYRHFHAEPTDMSANPLQDGIISANKNPWDSNQAIPTLLVGSHKQEFAMAVPRLRLRNVDWFSFFAYPLSGGFRPWSLLPQAITPKLLKLEWSARKILGRLAAFRLMAVYYKDD